jgi:hypothetical protein
MWKKQDDAASPSDLVSTDNPDLASLGDALVQSLVNEQFTPGPIPPAPQIVAPETYSPASQPPGMKVYTEAATEFTSHASSFLQHLPLLAKARAAYAEAIRASAEMRQVLDAGDERLRTLMTQLEQAMSVHGVKPPLDKKVPEPTKIDRIKPAAEAGGRAIRWP